MKLNNTPPPDVTAVKIANERLTFDLEDGRSVSVPLAFYPTLMLATAKERRHFEISHSSVYWPEEKIEQRHMDVARSIQLVTEEIMVRLARHAREVTGQKNLCLAGGVALNCVANGIILREKIFENIWIQAAAGDAGGALGAALAAWHVEKPRVAISPDSMQASLLGPGFFDDEIESVRAHTMPFFKNWKRTRCWISPLSFWKRKKSSAGFKEEWNLARARLATARFSATRV